ncbi:MAG: hypothetical protein Q9170_004835 [Blastenia crenularia]
MSSVTSIEHTSSLPGQSANQRPTGIPRPKVLSKEWTTWALESRIRLDTAKGAVKKGAVKPKTSQPKAILPAAVKLRVVNAKAGKPRSPVVAAPVLKSALKSSSGGKTEKKVSFAEIGRTAEINEHAVWSRPGSSTPTKEPHLVDSAGSDLGEAEVHEHVS